MKLLRVKASHFKNCEDGYTIDLVARSKKTSEDKEYELQEIAEGLFTFNAVVIAGKNASGKSSALKLLELAYGILGNFRVEKEFGTSYDGVELEIIFFHEGSIYKYEATLRDKAQPSIVQFDDERLYGKRYYKTNIRSLYEFGESERIKGLTPLPKDTSSLFHVLKDQSLAFISLHDQTESSFAYRYGFIFLSAFKEEKEVLSLILKVFDENIDLLEMLEGDNYRLRFLGEERILSGQELFSFLSRGTTKGIALYAAMILSLLSGVDLLIDEIENHFHKSLVENLICLYKDKRVNRKQATIIFTTHYPELLDDIGRQDNVFICRTGRKVSIASVHDGYQVRSELLKSRQFLNNAFDTAVDYDRLMALKEALMK